MTPRTRKKRFHLSLVVAQAHKMLFTLLGVLVIGLFILQLSLMNTLAVRGFALSQNIEKHKQLLQKTEQIDVQLARLQTQEFVSKVKTTQYMVNKGFQRFVYIPTSLTASLPPRPLQNKP